MITMLSYSFLLIKSNSELNFALKRTQLKKQNFGKKESKRPFLKAVYLL